MKCGTVLRGEENITYEDWTLIMRRLTYYMIMVLFFAGLLIGLPRHSLSEELPKASPVSITADKLDYDRVADIYTAVGHVKIEHEGTRLEADKVVLNNKTGEATAEGNVLLQDKQDMAKADRLQVNINTRSGVMYKGDLFKKKENIHFRGDVIERRSETVYHVDRGIITTCDEDQWYFKANEFNVDMDRYATARGITFNMLGVPVFYTPYFLFPVKRLTGFLLPTYGNSSLDGLTLQNAFFWAISDYKDMTFYSDYRGKTGHGTGLEFRYMNSIESSGQAYVKFWNMFRSGEIRQSHFGHETGETRWELRLQHQEEIAEDLSVRVDINQVSDEHYYQDLDKQLEIKSKPYLDSNAFFVERWNTAALYLLGQYSTDLTQPNRATIQKLPEIRYMMFSEPLLGPLHANFDGSAVNFSRQEGDSLRRLDFNPNFAAAFGGNGLSLTPRVGARATLYDRKGPNAAINEPTSRTYLYAGLDLNARLSRVYGADQEEGIGKIRHSIEPTISYSYIPEFKRDNIPQFDPVDSVVSMNTVTVSLINRVTAHYKESKDAPNFTNFDLMVFRISQAYNLTAMDTTSHPSAVQADLFVNAPKYFSASASGSYNTDTGHLSSRNVSAGLATDPLQLTLSYLWSREAATPGEYLAAGGILKLGKWNLSAQYSFDIANNLMTQQEYRVRYGAQCWGITVVFVRSPGDTRITAMLDLKGLGGGLGK
jgi:LPS-assembly protein